jgi:hypothetical protein
VRHGLRLFVVGLALLGLAAAASAVLRVAYGVRPAFVHVRWAPTVDEATRLELERTYSLTRSEPRDDRTWGYFLTDLSNANIRGLVTNPAAEDTHNLHRTAFRVWRTAPRADYPGDGPVWIAVGLEFLVRAGLGLGGVALLLGGYWTWQARHRTAARVV